MEFSWSLALVVFALNALACLMQFAVQQWEHAKGHIPARHSIIPNTNQKFLYWQDFHTQTWGDLIGVAAIWIAFAHLEQQGVFAGILPWVAFLIIATTDSRYFMNMCLRPSHKPDWGYPASGEMSYGGLVHLFYHGSSVAATALMLFELIIGKLEGYPLFIFWNGLAVIALATWCDAKAGHFEKLRPVLTSINGRSPYRS